ncbi:MAG: DUF6323 family protein [Syntrophomonadaceae bacterium]
MRILDIFKSPEMTVKLQLNDILQMNDQTRPYGLLLSETQARELIETRNQAILEQGRVELSTDSLQKIIKVFSSSAYISSSDYAPLLNELVEIFYFMKNETHDRISDDELINIMKELFDGPSRGSAELLKHRDLPLWSRMMRGNR